MTKELDLFKRWIGKTDILDAQLESNTIIIHSLLPTITVYVPNHISFSKKFLKILLSNKCFFDLEVNNYGNEKLEQYCYKIPKKYHHEWKAYIGEAK